MKFPALIPNLLALKHTLFHSVYFAFRANHKVVLGDVEGRGRSHKEEGEIFYSTLMGTLLPEKGQTFKIDLRTALVCGHVRCLIPGVTQLLNGQTETLVPESPNLWEVVDRDAQIANLRKPVVKGVIRLSDVANPPRRKRIRATSAEKTAFNESIREEFTQSPLFEQSVPE